MLPCSGIGDRRRTDGDIKIVANCRMPLLMLVTTMGLLDGVTALTVSTTSVSSGVPPTSSSDLLTLEAFNLSATFSQINMSSISSSSSWSPSNYTPDVTTTDSISNVTSFNVTEEFELATSTTSSPVNATAAVTTANRMSLVTSSTSESSSLSSETARNRTTVDPLSSASISAARPTQTLTSQTTRVMSTNVFQLNSSGSYDVNGTTAIITNYSRTSVTPVNMPSSAVITSSSAGITLTVATATGISTTERSNSSTPAVTETLATESTSEQPASSLSTKELALAIGLGGGGALLIILLIGIVICVTKCGRRSRSRNKLTDDVIEKAANGTGSSSGHSKKRKRKKKKNQPNGVDNIRLTPVIVDQPTHGRSKPKTELHKPSKRRNKRGSVQQLTLAFAENEMDCQNSQKQAPSNGDVFVPNGDTDRSESLASASASVPVITTATTKSKMKDKGRVRIRRGASPHSPVGRTVTFAEEPAASTSATTTHGVPSHLMTSPASSAIYVKPTTMVFDDDLFPPPPPIGFVNPQYSQQFDPPRQQSPRHDQRPVLPGGRLLLTQASIGESATDVNDVQENPLFAFAATE